MAPVAPYLTHTKRNGRAARPNPRIMRRWHPSANLLFAGARRQRVQEEGLVHPALSGKQVRSRNKQIGGILSQSPALVENEILWHSSCRCQNRGTLHAPGALHSLIPTFLSTSWLGFASLPGWRCSRLRSGGKFMKSRSGRSIWV